MRAAALFSIAALAFLAGCGPERVSMPPVPTEIQAVAASYDNPMGTVPVDAQQEIAQLQQKLDAFNQTRLGDVISDALMRLRERLEASDVSGDPAARARHPQWPTIRGSITIDRTCRGWDDTSTTPNPADGKVEVIAEIDNSMLQRVVWGTATMCKGRVDVTNGVAVHPFLDGTLAVYLEGPLPSNANDANFILGWSGTLGLEQNPTLATGSSDYRVVSGQVETRIMEPDGDIIGSVGVNEVSLRGSNGTFGCSLVTSTCGMLQTARGSDQGP
jgi:hypothetical protein